MDKAGPSTPKKVKQRRGELPKNEKSPPRKQRFRQEWLQKDEFRGWLTEVKDDPFHALCKACNSKLVAGHSELVKHSNRESHKRSVKVIAHQPSAGSFFQRGKSSKGTGSTQDDIKKLEIILSGVFAEHNISMNTIDHLIDALKIGIPNCDVIQGVSLHRTKCSYIIKNVIAKANKKKLIETLKEKKFSILVDEGTDISKVKIIAVLVRYFDDEGKGRVVTQLLEAISHDARNSDAETLSKVVKSCFVEKSIPLTNIIAMAADNASVLVGKNNSLMTKLQRDADESFFTLKCICHSLHIVASKATSNLPRNIEDFVRNIASYFSHSSKRQAELAELQEYLAAERHKMLRLSDTRWLAMQHCIERILNQWEVLKLLFFQAQIEDKVISAELIMKEFNNPYTKAYLTFFKYVLGYFNQLNVLFQSKNNLIGILQDESLRMTRLICKNFIKPQYLSDLSRIDPNNEAQLIPLSQIELGYECEALLATTKNLEGNKHFRQRCLSFYQTAFMELVKRLPLFDSLYSEMKFVISKVALDIEVRKKLPNLETLAKKYEHLVGSVNEIQKEWNDLPIYFNSDECEMLKKKNNEEFWVYLSQLKNYSDEFVFKNLAYLAKLVLTLPHSNAETERIFSMMGDAKTKKRNKMGPELLDSILFINSNLKSKGENCLYLAKGINEDYLSFHNVQMYDFKQSESS
ncbi:general transcription factor II-I repeat domain-containing protein 2-like [Palaemon carinicauda]|uniref:general transcription factor II-I repeat domain-containing protein 2-like n=1 Tax=Palaemon carinicauda TaxID=392227 RepID=UPI0035B5E0AB